MGVLTLSSASHKCVLNLTAFFCHDSFVLSFILFIGKFRLVKSRIADTLYTKKIYINNILQAKSLGKYFSIFKLLHNKYVPSLQCVRIYLYHSIILRIVY